jgi:hypothetical protein
LIRYFFQSVVAAKVQSLGSQSCFQKMAKPPCKAVKIFFGRNVGARSFVVWLFMSFKPLRILSDLNDAVFISDQTEIIVKTSRGRPIWLRQIP